MTEAEHFEKFKQCVRNFRAVAEQVAKIDPEFSHLDTAKAVLVAASDMLVADIGDAGLVACLRQLADMCEASGVPAVLN